MVNNGAMSLLSPRLLKVLLLLVLAFIILQYSYTTIFEARRIDPLFIVNSSLLARNQFFFMKNRSNYAINKNSVSWTSDGAQMTNALLVDATASQNLASQQTYSSNELCPLIPPNLLGPIKPEKDAPATLEELEHELEAIGALPPSDGQWRPSYCKARDRVAIIIPYRDRAHHLNIFLKNIHPFLQRQQIDYGIFVIEQAGYGMFNRAMLMNVGFVEALKFREFDCFIFHDVDLLPEDDRNLYTCPDQPRHMSVAVDSMKYRLPYSDLFGGVSAMTKSQFELVNGFSNMYWGWGGEDDDMAARLKSVGLHISRYPNNIARYTMLSHRKEKANPKRFEILYSGRKRIKEDGLNSLQYRRLSLIRNRSLTWVLVELAVPS
ncbi:beta-1,4-N-acetylgalactosaminyltransferase bre-4-like isoform X3 [Lycorma delicatula]|uniref:beta-1,4-N-acetylgalactosaminyltransferase bre-4-like isoform X3 n=1 Tax=Lycorma delicatula TaxID=130591 RepID=UPI003F50E467